MTAAARFFARYGHRSVVYMPALMEWDDSCRRFTQCWLGLWGIRVDLTSRNRRW